MKIGIVVPHMFMQKTILPDVIFAPAELALNLAEGLRAAREDVTLFTPGPVATTVRNHTADLSYFERELSLRGDTYMSLLKKHPFTFITLARQVQSELIAKAYEEANKGNLDLVHIYTNEEELALSFARLCNKPVVFTNHDPFNFLIKHKSVFPKYASENWLSISMAQRKGMPKNTNWIGNIYHGIPKDQFRPNYNPQSGYIAYLGRIINTKGVHLAIQGLRKFNDINKTQLKLKIAGKHYAESSKDTYWKTYILPELERESIEYAGYLKDVEKKQDFLGNAKALIMPSTFEEPFGLVMIESLACATPVIGLRSGAIPEVIEDQKSGLLVPKYQADAKTIDGLTNAISRIHLIDRHACRKSFESRFTLCDMVNGHIEAYRQLI